MAYAAAVVAFITGMIAMALFLTEQPWKAVALIITGSIVVEVLLAMART